MHNLPRLNGCGASNERQYCFLSADEIFVFFNEPFFGDMSLTEVLSFGGCVNMAVQEYILLTMFPRTPYAQSAAAEWPRRGYQMKGNIVFYLLMKFFSLLTSRFSTICL